MKRFVLPNWITKMSTLKISAKGIDEVNFVFKRIKKEYDAIGKVKLNQDTMEYELIFEKKQLDSWLMSICDKVIDMDDLYDGESIKDGFSRNGLNEWMEADKCPVQLKALHQVWKELSNEKRWACYTYLCEEMDLEIEVEEGQFIEG